MGKIKRKIQVKESWGKKEEELFKLFCNIKNADELFREIIVWHDRFPSYQKPKRKSIKEELEYTNKLLGTILNFLTEYFTK